MRATVIYYNVQFVINLETEQDVRNFEFLKNRIEKCGTTMEEIANWCRRHGVEYASKFNWKEEYPLLANLWNLYSYIRFRCVTRKRASSLWG